MVWSAQTCLRFGFPRDAGAEMLRFATARAPHRTQQSCTALRAHPERRHAAALQTIEPPHSGVRAADGPRFRPLPTLDTARISFYSPSIFKMFVGTITATTQS